MTAIRVELELADGSFTTKLLHAGQSVDKFVKSVEQSTPAMKQLAASGKPVIQNMQLSAEASRSFLSVLRDLSVVAGIFSYGISKLTSVQDGWIGSIVKTNMEMERLNYQMQAMATSANPIQEAADSIDYLRQKSLEMPFAFNTITEAFVKMKATGTDPLNGSLQALADGVAAAGGDDEAMKRAVLAVSQISGKGVLQMEELRQQLGESMPQAAALLARSMGVSMSTLIQEISTGTVQAKPALKALYDELDRTYGGRAQMMMETFSGQVQRTRTLLQQLSTDGTLKTSFYDGALREQIEDLNTFLSGQGAAALRDDLGNALTAIVQGFRTLVDTAIEFRSEIGRLAIVFAAVFSARAAGRGIESLIEGFNNLKTATRAAGLQAQITLGAFQEFRAQQAQSGMTWSLAARNVVGYGSAVKTYMMAFAAWMPVITAVGFAVYGAAEYFGIFADKANDAYQEMKKFGSETRAQAEAIRDAKLKSLEDQVEAEKAARLESLEGLKVDEKTGQLVPDDSIGKLWTLKQEIAEIRKESQGLVEDAAERESQAAVDKVTKTVNRTLNAASIVYDQTMREVDERYNQLEKIAAENGKSVAQVTRQRARETYLIQKEFYDKQIAELKVFYEEQKKLQAKASTDQERKNAEAVLGDLSQRLDSLIEKRRQLQEPGIVKMAKAPDEEKAFARGQEMLKKMQAEAAALEEELAGGYATAAKLRELVKQGKFGSADKEQVKLLAEELVNQAKLNEQTREQIRLQKEKNRIYDNGVDKADKMRAEIEGLRAELAGEDGNLAELKKALELGEVGDAGSEKVQKLIAELTSLMATRERLRAQAKQLRESNQLFENGQNNLRGITADIKGMLGALEGANEKVAEMNELLASGKYGDQDQVRVMALRDALLSAIDAKEKLDELMDARKELLTDAERAAENAATRLAEAQIEATGRQMTEAEKILFKLDNGFYKGLGKNSKAEQAIRETAEALSQQSVSAETLADVLKNKTFGPETVTRINSVADAVRGLATEFGALNGSLNSTNFQNFGLGIGEAITGQITPVMQNLPQDVTARMKDAMVYLMQKGWSQSAAAGIVGNLVSESNMNPNAIGDNGNAFGLAQWNDRGPAMKAFLASKGKAWNDFFGQLDFIDHELRTSEAKAGNRLMLARDARSAAEIAMNDYERPAIWARQKTGGERAGNAEQAFKLTQGGAAAYGPQLPVNGMNYVLAYQKDITRETEAQVDFEKAQVSAMAEKREAFQNYKRQLTEGNATAEASARTTLEQADADERRAQTLERQNELTKKRLEIEAENRIASGEFGKLGKEEADVYKQILMNKEDPRAEKYREMIRLAKELDQADAIAATNKKVRTQQEDMAMQASIERRKTAERQKQLADPNYVPLSDEYIRKEAEYEQHLSRMRSMKLQETEAYKQMEAQKGTVLTQIRQKELAESQLSRSEKIRDAQMSNMTQSQQAMAAMQQEIARIDAEVAAFQGSEQEKVEFVRIAEEQKAKIRQQYAQKMDPLGKQMQSWGDIQGNLAQASTRWMDSLAGGLTDLIMGTGDLRSAIQGILKDMLNMGIKYLMSGMMGGKNGSSGAKSGLGKAGRSAGGKLATGGKGKLPGAANGGLIKGLNYRQVLRGFDIGGYTGDGGKYEPAGIVHKGEYVMPKAATKVIGVDNLRALHRRALNGRLAGNQSMLQGFAEGGLVGGGMARENAPISVPSSKSVKEQGGKIAQSVGSGVKNEINVTNNINATGGTPQQNEDAAKKIAKEMEASMRTVVVDEMRKQMRPGNILNNGRRR